MSRTHAPGRHDGVAAVVEQFKNLFLCRVPSACLGDVHTYPVI